MLVACATPEPAAPMPESRPAVVRVPQSPVLAPLPPLSVDDDIAELPATRHQARSRWVAVRWAELPGFSDDALHEAWNAWLKSCERPGPAFAALCPEVRVLSLASPLEQRRWMMQRLQPYRVEPLNGGGGDGLLTAYYEPVLQASRVQQGEFDVPLYRPPQRLSARKPWFTRKEMETLPEAQAALRGHEIAWLANPVDALLLQIQGSGRLNMREPDGQQHMVRLAYAATNDQPYGLSLIHI